MTELLHYKMKFDFFVYSSIMIKHVILLGNRGY